MNNLRRAPKGKLPYIEDDGQLIADSGFIIPYLQEKYGHPVNEPTDARQRGALRGITRMLDEDLYFAVVYARWLDEDNWKTYTFPNFFGKMPLPVRVVVSALIRRNVKKSLRQQGIGRHAPDEIMAIGLRNLEAVRDYLGNNPFIAGEEICVADATVYSFLAQAVKPPHASPMKDFVASESALMDYIARIDTRLT